MLLLQGTNAKRGCPQKSVREVNKCVILNPILAHLFDGSYSKPNDEDEAGELQTNVTMDTQYVTCLF